MMVLACTSEGGIPVVLHKILYLMNIETCFRIHLEIVVFMALLPISVLFELSSVLIIHISFPSPFFSLKQTWPTCS